MKARQSLLIFLLTLIVARGFGQRQSHAAIKQFLNEFVNEREKAPNLYYYEYLPDETIDTLVNKLNFNPSDSVFWDYDGHRVLFNFSPEEKELIKGIWLAQKKKPWDRQLLQRGTLFQKKPLPDNYTREQWLEYMKQFDGKYTIQFSTPVFFRDNLCIFFYVDGGGGSMFIMRKEDKKWVKYLQRTLFYI
jgi:hypothetical protein